MDAWLLWFNASFWTWLYDLVPWIQARANDTESWANQASQSATTASLTANASMWNPSTNYALGQNAISPTTFQTYRRRVAGVSATDPVSDATNWTPVAAVPDESVTTEKLAPNAVTTEKQAPNSVTPDKLANGGRELGFRNRLINAQGNINQRGYVSGTTTTGANQYTVDRWRVVVSGQALSWTTSGNDLTFTAPAGGVEQVIEGLNLETGTYVLSWTGTATATVGGSAVANGGTVSVTGGVNLTVRFSGGTFTRPQFEPGSVATPFDRRDYGRELIMCQRYYEKSFDGANPVTVTGTIQTFNPDGSINTGSLQVVFKVTKRAAPTVVSFSPATGAAGFLRDGSGSDRAATVQFVGTNSAHITNAAIGNIGNYSAHFTASIEL
jgi:hypothetical protein